MKNIILSFITGLLAGIALTLSLQSCNGDSYKRAQSKTVAQETEKQVAKSEINYVRSYDSLKTQSAKLESLVQGTRVELEKAKQKSYALQKTVNRFSDLQLEKQTSVKTIAKTPCDSLAVTVGDLIQTSDLRDSLYETQATNLGAQVKNKDAALSLKVSQYQDIKAAFMKGLDEQAATTKENKALNRQLKRQKVKSKLLSAAILVLSGAAANYMMHH